MGKKHIIVLVLTAIFSSLSLYAQDENECVVFVNTPGSSYSQPYQLSKFPLFDRGYYAQGTVIKVIYDNPTEWNNTQRRAIEYAARLWEEQLVEAFPAIRLKVKKANLGSNIAQTYTKDYLSDSGTRYGRVSSVFAKIMQLNNPDFLSSYFNDNFDEIFLETDDITIILNNDDEMYYWGTDCRVPQDKYDVVTLIIREIAKGCEIRNTLVSTGSSVVFQRPDDLTVFDRYLSATNPTGNRTIGGLPFYGPNPFQQGVSYFYLAEDFADAYYYSFLRPTLPKGFASHHIGEEITLLLRNEFLMDKQLTVGDYSPSMPNTTTTSVPYSGATFTASEINLISYTHQPHYMNNGDSIALRSTDNHNYGSYYQPEEGKNCSDDNNWEYWKVFVLRNDGYFEEVYHNASDILTITPSTIPYRDDWARNADGHLRAKLVHRTEARNPYPYAQSTTYTYLDYLPLVPDADVVTLYTQYGNTRMIIPEPRITFNTIGATSIQLRHDSEDGSFIQFFNPDVEYVDLDYVDPYIENSFTITAINANGSKTSDVIHWGGEEFLAQLDAAYTLNVCAIGNSLKLSLENEFIASRGITPRQIEHFQIVNLNTSTIVLQGSAENRELEMSISPLPIGIYAVQVTDNAGQSYNAKFVKR